MGEMRRNDGEVGIARHLDSSARQLMKRDGSYGCNAFTDWEREPFMYPF